MPQRNFKRYEKRSERNKCTIELSPETLEKNELNRAPNNCGSTNEQIIPNRVFVGGIPSNVTELDIKNRLSMYGTVKAVRIIRDCIGESKGYGFVTFNLEDDAKKAMEKREIMLKGRKLHVAPAVKKKINHSETNLDYSSGAYSLEKYPVLSRGYEYRNARKQEFKFEHISGNEGFPQFSEMSNFLMESGQCYGVTDMLSPYGNSQMSLLSYPTLVYVPQQAFQYSGAVTPIYLGTSIPEILQLIPAPMCCMNGQQ